MRAYTKVSVEELPDGKPTSKPYCFVEPDEDEMFTDALTIYDFKSYEDQNVDIVGRRGTAMIYITYSECIRIFSLESITGSHLVALLLQHMFINMHQTLANDMPWSDNISSEQAIYGYQERRVRDMGQWAYKVVYIDYRGRISCEGVETLIGDERRSAFARRYLNTLGREEWELVSIQPLTPNSAYYIFKRPAREGDYADEVPTGIGTTTQTPPEKGSEPDTSPNVESA